MVKTKGKIYLLDTNIIIDFFQNNTKTKNKLLKIRNLYQYAFSNCITSQALNTKLKVYRHILLQNI